MRESSDLSLRMSAQLFDNSDVKNRPEEIEPPSSDDHELLRLAASLSLKLIINGAVPVVVYLLLRYRTRSQLIALAAASAIPVSRMALRMMRKRRIEMTGALAAAGFVGALLLSFAGKGNPLVPKLYHSAIAGAIGITLLVSAIGRKPFVFDTLTRLARDNPKFRVMLDRLSRGVDSVQTVRIATMIVAATLLVEAATHATLALTVPTKTFLVAGHIAGWTIRCIGAAATLWYLRWTRTHHAVSSVDDRGHLPE